MPNRNSLKLGLPIDVFPRNIQDVGLNGADYGFKPSNLILSITCRPAIDPSPVINDRFFVWLDRFDGVKPNMHAGRGCETLLVLQKYRQNLHGLEEARRGVSDLHQHSWMGINESDDKRRSIIVPYHNQPLWCP